MDGHAPSREAPSGRGWHRDARPRDGLRLRRQTRASPHRTALTVRSIARRLALHRQTVRAPSLVLGFAAGGGDGGEGPARLHVRTVDPTLGRGARAGVNAPTPLLPGLGRRVSVPISLWRPQCPHQPPDVNTVMSVYFAGVLLLVRAVLPSMRRRGPGRVIGTSSTAGVLGMPFYGLCAAPNFAIYRLWESCYAKCRGFDGTHFSLVRWGVGTKGGAVSCVLFPSFGAR